jgi:hypothetical protein
MLHANKEVHLRVFELCWNEDCATIGGVATLVYDTIIMIKYGTIMLECQVKLDGLRLIIRMSVLLFIRCEVVKTILSRF